MKKTALVVLLAAVFVMATAASAFAAIAPTYATWTAGGANAGSADTPHADYQLHTEKCAVCHSVHNAPATVPVGATGETELLLRSSASDACTYCHIDSNIGGKVVYDGNATNYRTEMDANHSTIAGCTKCHSVHSANTIGGLVTPKILRDGQLANGANYFYEDAYLDDLYGAGWDETDVDAEADRDVQISVFCTKCHDNWSAASETTINAYGYLGIPGYGYKEVKHHPMKAADVVFNAQGASTTTQVAWVDANYCRSCHDAGQINQPAGTITSSWPHYTPGSAMFLQVFTDAASNTGSGTVAADGADTGADDGACIKCHISGAGQGAGVSY